MASCQKCGKYLKRRKGKAKCSRCGPLPEIRLNGHLPQNPWGSCFDAAAHNLLGNDGWGNPRICHGIGIANKPGEEGKRIAHAWIEIDHPERGKTAIDPIWLLAQSAEEYRENLKVEFVMEYSREEFLWLWKTHDYPGPYHEKIKAVIERKAA